MEEQHYFFFFISGEKMKNPSDLQGENERQRKKNLDKNTYDSPSIKVTLHGTIRNDDF